MASHSLVDEIGEYALSGRSLRGVPLNYKCCAFELTDGRIPNCVSKTRKHVYSPASFETFNSHMWKVHMIDAVVMCAKVVVAKQQCKDALTIAPKTTKKITLFAPEKTDVKTAEKAAPEKTDVIEIEYKLFDGSFCTKADYDEAMNNYWIEQGVDDWE